MMRRLRRECLQCLRFRGLEMRLVEAWEEVRPEGPRPAVRRKVLRCPVCGSSYDADPWWWERGPGARERGAV